MDGSFFIILGVMVTMGVLGGIISYIISPYEKWDWEEVGKSIVVGVGASIMVPLFLKMISSNLLDDVGRSNLEFFPLMGFCLIAAISSRHFIDSMTRKILANLEDQAKENAAQIKEFSETVKPVIQQATEPGESDADGDEVESKDQPLTENQRELLEVFLRSSFTFRSLRGIYSDIGIHDADGRRQIRQDLRVLLTRGLVGKTNANPEGSKRKALRFFVTGRGRMTYLGDDLRRVAKSAGFVNAE